MPKPTDYGFTLITGLLWGHWCPGASDAHRISLRRFPDGNLEMACKSRTCGIVWRGSGDEERTSHESESQRLRRLGR